MQSLTYDDFFNGGREDEELTVQDREDMENEALEAQRTADWAEYAKDEPIVSFEFALNNLIRTVGVKGEQKVALLEEAYRKIEEAFDQLMVDARTTAEAVKISKARLGLRVRAERSDANKPRKAKS